MNVRPILVTSIVESHSFEAYDGHYVASLCACAIVVGSLDLKISFKHVALNTNAVSWLKVIILRPMTRNIHQTEL